MKLRLEKKTVKEGENFELPDFSFNHAYIASGEEVILYYLVAVDKENMIKAFSAEIMAHLLGVYR